MAVVARVNLSAGELTVLFDREDDSRDFRAYPSPETPKAASWLARRLPHRTPDDTGSFLISRAEVVRLVERMLEEAE